MDKNKVTNKNDSKPQPKGGSGFYWVYGLIAGGLILFSLFNNSGPGARKLSYNIFMDTILPSGDVAQIQILKPDGKAKVFLKEEALTKDKYKDVRKDDNAFSSAVGSNPQYVIDYGDLGKFQEDIARIKKEKKLSFSYNFVGPSGMSALWNALSWLIFPVIFLFIWLFVLRRMSTGSGPGGQLFNIGRSKARLFDENDNVRITFKDVAGLQGAKEEIEEIVSFLKQPDRYTLLGGKIPKGALLVGPPGTGKTLLAKAVAGEAKVPFFSLSGSDFVEMFVGVGASRVRDLFKQAKEKAPSIIFIDEIDAIGRARGKNSITGGNDERENTLNQLLTEMDGFGTNTNVIVIAATNRADILDTALMRAGRFDRRIYVDLPDLKERAQIFDVHLKPIKIAKGLDVEFLARQTPGFSGADIANICNEAALIAARNGKKRVDRQDFLDAVDRIIGGLEKKNKIIKPQEKKRIAFHEAGHATTSWLLEHAAPLVKVTIVPRGQSLGAAWYLPEERQITTTEQMLDEICATLGGRAAEWLIFKNISTGALSDLEKVTKQAQAMVTIFGLNEKVGNISYYESGGQRDYPFSKPYSEETARIIDEEIKKIADAQYRRAIGLLTENRDKLTELANMLLEREVIFKDDLVKIFGPRTSDAAEDIADAKPPRDKPRAKGGSNPDGQKA